MGLRRELLGGQATPFQAALAMALRGLLRFGVRPAFRPGMRLGVQRFWLNTASRASLVAGGVPRHRARFGSVPAEILGRPQGPVLLYLHGGGYVSGSPATRRSLTSHLARRLNATVVVPAYRLAPEHPCPAALDDALMVYQRLLDKGHDASHIAVGGDAAGGGLTLALLQRIRDSALPAPAAGVLLSPWLDLTVNQEQRSDIGETLLNVPWLAQAARLYAGDDLARPQASPLYGDLNGLPPLLIQSGGDELLRVDSERLADRLRATDTPSRYQLFPRRWHVFQTHAGLLADADLAVAEIGDFLHQKWEKAVNNEQLTGNSE
ncbi:alpha/beta hydrolase [Alloalcanivorax xenomutans]|nr:alpha/beta hydrolase [Alloalcanivorax xenomutans]WOA32358.1 alpha/beta hydrolase [Alloalcanivorax xenomutans]SOB89448.1 acetyl esterase/lipase [Alloalcanivorax xenomutans]